MSIEERLKRVYAASEMFKEKMKRLDETLLMELKKLRKTNASSKRKNKSKKSPLKDSTTSATASNSDSCISTDISAVTNASDISIDVSCIRRPRRAASRLACTNIKYQQMSLSTKLRRPDGANDVDEFGFLRPSALANCKKGESVQERSNKEFAKPLPKRSQKVRKSALSSLDDEPKVNSCPPSVKEKIANFERLAHTQESAPQNGTVVNETEKLVPSCSNEDALGDKTYEVERTLEVNHSPKDSSSFVKRQDRLLRKSSSRSRQSAVEDIRQSTNVTFTTEIININITPGDNNHQLRAGMAVASTSSEQRFVLGRAMSDVLFESPLEASSPVTLKKKEVENNQNLMNSIVSLTRYSLNKTARASDGKKRKKKMSKVGNCTVENDTMANASQCNERVTRTKTRRVKRSFEETLEHAYLGPYQSVNVEPSTSATFILNETRNAKRTKAKKMRKIPALDSTLPPLDVDGFVIPEIPLLIGSQRTDVVAEMVTYDAYGNPLTEAARSTRTKTLAAPTSSLHLPEVDSTEVEGRPTRTRTKVRRYGDDENTEQRNSVVSTTVDDDAPARSTRSKRPKNQQGESAPTKRQSTNSRKTYRKSGRYKTPLSSVTNRLLSTKILVSSATKSGTLTVKKRFVDDFAHEHELKKEELAAQKKEMELNRKKILLKKKNEEKLQRALKCREKRDIEKQEQILQAEKEKELKLKEVMEKRKERQMAELHKKKLATSQKKAQYEQRRRLEEEARLARIREIEMEEQKQIKLKLEQQQLEEKRARERLEEKRKLQEQEKLLKQNLVEMKQVPRKPRALPISPISTYKPKNENDFGLEDEHSELNSDDESPPTPKRNPPSWVSELKSYEELLKDISLEMITSFAPSAPKTPNVHKIFNMTPARSIRRNSSAIWNTPGYTP